MTAQAWGKAPKRSWVTVDEQASLRIPITDPIQQFPIDCADLFEQAQRKGLNPSIPTQHLLVFTAEDRVHVRLDSLYAVQIGGKTAPQRLPVARTRWTCDAKPGPLDLHGDTETEGETFSTRKEATPESLLYNFVFDIGEGAETTMRIAIDPLPGNFPYDYDLIANVEINGSLRQFTLDDAGHPFLRR